MTIIEREELLCSKYNTVYSFLASHGVKRDDREDLLHEVIIKALRGIKQLSDTEKMDSWLWVITANTVKAHYGKQKWEQQRAIIMEEKDLNAQIDKISEEDYYQEIRHLSHLANWEEVVDALRGLNHKTLVIFRLYYFLGYPLKEVAQMVGTNYSTVKSLHTRGLKRLRETLSERK